jgi:hypothetical protein
VGEFRELAASVSASGASDYVTRTSAREISPGVSVIDDPPGVLATRAGVDVETYSLARVIASEGYPGGTPLQLAVALSSIGHVIKSEAKARGQSITRLLTGGTAPGYYGSQKAKGYAATTRDPRVLDVAVAKAVLGGIPDLTRGARNFVHPKVWGDKEARGETATQAGAALSEFETVMRRWHTEKAYVGGVPSIDSYRLMFFRRERDAKKREAAFEACMAVYRAGMAGKSVADPRSPDSVVARGRGLFAAVLAAIGGWTIYKGNS